MEEKPVKRQTAVKDKRTVTYDDFTGKEFSGMAKASQDEKALMWCIPTLLHMFNSTHAATQ